eukprot:12755905-Ditylum_brightwellii.AAC.1
MEPQAALHIIEKVAGSESGIYVTDLSMDDDTTTMVQPANEKKWVCGFSRQCKELADMKM